MDASCSMCRTMLYEIHSWIIIPSFLLNLLHHLFQHYGSKPEVRKLSACFQIDFSLSYKEFVWCLKNRYYYYCCFRNYICLFIICFPLLIPSKTSHGCIQSFYPAQSHRYLVPNKTERLILIINHLTDCSG